MIQNLSRMRNGNIQKVLVGAVSGILFYGVLQVNAAPVKNRVRAASSSHATLGSSACELCHKPQNTWWPENAHYKTAEPFFKADRKNVKIGRLYGIASPSDMTKGNQVCMECHGTIVSESEAEDVLDGVGCEACHGPAEGYLKPHKAGDKSLGETRPGYLKGLELGMIKLRDMNIRAKTCSSCHMITDPRLISAGHPSGDRFDFVEGLTYIKHWDRSLGLPDLLKQAYQRVEAERRGASAEMPLRPPPASPPPSPPPPSSPAPSGTPASTPSSTENTTAPKPPQTPEPAELLLPGPSAEVRLPNPNPIPPPPPPRPTPMRPLPVPRASKTTNTVEISDKSLLEEPSRPVRSPFPKIDPSASTDEILLIIKKRLELLHAELYP